MQLDTATAGTKTGDVSMATNDSDESPFNFRITGRVMGTLVQAVPHSQDFSLGKPGAAQGWEYYSDAEGRIEVVAGRLRLDDTTDNSASSLNEALLHVDLTGQTGVTLRLEHTSLMDENTALPASFDGHYSGDGIALSVDGDVGTEKGRAMNGNRQGTVERLLLTQREAAWSLGVCERTLFALTKAGVIWPQFHETGPAQENPLCRAGRNPQDGLGKTSLKQGDSFKLRLGGLIAAQCRTYKWRRRESNFLRILHPKAN